MRYQSGLTERAVALDPEFSDQTMEGCKLINSAMQERLGGEESSEDEKDKLELWKVFFLNLSKLYERNGNKRGIIFDDRILN